MRVSVLELPYIFGVMPEREPLWKQVLLDRLVKMPVVLYPAGGSAMISAKHVGEAVVGSIVHGKHGHPFLPDPTKTPTSAQHSHPKLESFPIDRIF